MATKKNDGLTPKEAGFFGFIFGVLAVVGVIAVAAMSGMFYNDDPKVEKLANRLYLEERATVIRVDGTRCIVLMSGGGLSAMECDFK